MERGAVVIARPIDTVEERLKNLKTLEDNTWADAEFHTLHGKLTAIVQDYQIQEAHNKLDKHHTDQINKRLHYLDADLKRLGTLVLFSDLDERRAQESRQQAINYLFALYHTWNPEIGTPKPASSTNSPYAKPKFHWFVSFIYMIKQRWTSLKQYFNGLFEKKSNTSRTLKQFNQKDEFLRQFDYHQHLIQQLRLLDNRSLLLLPLTLVQKVLIRQELIASRRRFLR